MPEGPEIRIARDKLADVLLNKKVKQIHFSFEHLRAYESLFTAQKIISVESRGKALLTGFDNGYTIYSHNQLYGRWIIVANKQFPETRRQLRLAIHVEKYSALLYSASDIEVLNNQQLLEHRYLHKLGPELLSANITSDAVYQRLRLKRFARRNLISLLQDQSVLSGMGNYLCCEALHASKIHPRSRICDLNEQQLSLLAENCLRLTTKSYRTGGITNTDNQVEQLKQQGANFEDYRFLVYRRAGQACYSCGEVIVKDTYAGRMAYICPGCQQTG